MTAQEEAAEIVRDVVIERLERAGFAWRGSGSYFRGDRAVAELLFVKAGQRVTVVVEDSKP